MEAEVLKTNLKAVKELILDEHKLVTYISLSNELCIHVNEAKSLLYQTIQDIRRGQPEINICVCYMISGLLSNNSGCATVCTEKEIDTFKKTLKIVFFEHVYCVSRGLELVDNVALTAINKFEDLPLCTGLIKAACCTKRTDDEVGKLKSKNCAGVIKSNQTNFKQINSKHILKKVKEEIKGHEDNKKVNDIKSESSIKSEIISPKKNVTNNIKTPARTNSSKAGKGIAGFFNKVNSDPTKTKNSTKIQDAEVNVEDIKVEPSSTVSEISSKAKTNGSVMKKSKEKSNSNNSLTQLKKNAKVDKKRKRLLHVSDSESENEENDPFINEMDVDHQSEDEIPPTPTVNTVKITSGILNPKKRRKIVDKTYTDDDGYILTKKEEVYESCSENENEVTENSNQEKVSSTLVKENVKAEEVNKKITVSADINILKSETSPKVNKNKKKKISPPQKGKQSTINSFFKKV